MTTQRDPRLQALFAAAEQEFNRGAFRAEVMSRIDKERRRTVFLWSLASLVAVAALAILASPLLEALRIANQVLPASLVEVESDWLRQLTSPVNSVAAAIAVAAVGLQRFYRKIFH